MYKSALNFLSKVDKYRIYSDAEAWMLFKFSAIAETVGWMLLLYGIGSDKLHWPGQGYALPIGGTIHGMLFIGYLLIVLSAYSSLGWPRWKALVGITMSIVPGGTWGLEIWEAHRRKTHS